MNTNRKVVYGLTAATVDAYRVMVQYGLSWSHAMESLQRLYEHNKAFAESISTTK